MRWLLALVFLAGPAPRDDEAASQLFKAVREKIEGARTLRVESKGWLGQGAATTGTDTVVAKVKGKDRWMMRSTYAAGSFGPEPRTMHLVCDGRKTVRLQAPLPLATEFLGPAESAADIRLVKSTGVFPRVFMVEQGVGDPKFGPQPKPGPVRDAGREKVGNVEAQVLEYAFTYEWGQYKGQEVSVRLFVDPVAKRPLKREMRYTGLVVTDTYEVFAFDEPIADQEFTIQSKGRLSRAQVGQLSVSIERFGRFTGRHPRSLEDLVKRPVWLEPELFWPPGGFLLATAIPKDPWGRAFQLRPDTGALWVVGLGADGMPGGKGEDEDAELKVAPPPRQAIAAPTERLRRVFGARVQLVLLVAMLGAYRRAYAEWPSDVSALSKRPDWATVWPDGGWLPAGKMPLDPWGQDFQMKKGPGLVRIQVGDFASREIRPPQVTADERKALEAAAAPRLDEAEKKAVARLMDRLSDDDIKVREEAVKELDSWGLVIIPALKERARTETDPASRERWASITWALEHYNPPWMQELDDLWHVLSPSSVEEGDMASNERYGWSILKALAAAEADFRSNDRDGNGVKDFWTGDVAGLHTLAGADGRPNKLIDLSVALADVAPLDAGAAGGKYSAVTKFGERCAKSGYVVQAMTVDRSTDPPVAYRQDTGGKGAMGAVHHLSRFGFCAYPAEYKVTGNWTFIVNEAGTIYMRLTSGLSVLQWPTAREIEAEWQKLE